jgi:hypothetical protein
MTETISPIPTDMDALLRREAVGAALRAAGYPISDASLSTMASRGGGPRFRRFGRWPVYRWRDALAWAESRLSPPVTSTSELETARKSAA